MERYIQVENERIIAVSEVAFTGYFPIELSDVDYHKLTAAVETYRYVNGHLIQDTTLVSSTYRQYEISRLKEQLAGSDYKIIKCMEATLAGEPLPYDFATIRSERESLRKQINELEQEVLE